MIAVYIFVGLSRSSYLLVDRGLPHRRGVPAVSASDRGLDTFVCLLPDKSTFLFDFQSLRAS